MRIQVIDSHTGGEPTRVVYSGGPDLGSGNIANRLKEFAQRFDWFRSAVVNEPRGSDVLVGAWLLESFEPECDYGVIFFNNVGMLGMCGHGAIGLAETLRKMGWFRGDLVCFETVAGVVRARFRGDGWVEIENVPAYVAEQNVEIVLNNGQVVSGDVAWGGNWFFICEDHGQNLHLENVEALTQLSWEIRKIVNERSTDHCQKVDHIELVSPTDSGANAKNFVLCPGKAYDRSPCGTGTSAKLACLAARGKLEPGEIWRQESITGSVFEGSYKIGEGDTVLPVIAGQAWVTAESTLWLEPDDPLRHGIKA